MQIARSELVQVLSGFGMDGNAFAFDAVTHGHIHQSFKVIPDGQCIPAYLLQRINSEIFGDVAALMGNIHRVTAHLQSKVNEAAETNFVPLEYFATAAGKYFWADTSGKYWRLARYISPAITYNRVSDEKIARETGKGYGKFTALIADIELDDWNILLPRFHDLSYRLSEFRKSLELNTTAAAYSAISEISFAEGFANKMIPFDGLIAAKRFPLRLTHNDTKCNNILFNEDQKAMSVIDLDTVMPGCLLHDFGDAIRTAANQADEDETDFQQSRINLDYFSAFAQGYVSQTAHLLTTAEFGHLHLAPQLMTYIIGLRFLTDHLNGDVYFSTRYPGHNLTRARVQFELLRSMEKYEAKMKKIVAAIASPLSKCSR